MTYNRTLLDQPEEEVVAAMTEECALDCFGCPHATLQAAVIVSRANISQQMTSLATFEGLTPDITAAVANYEDTQREAREELSILTDGCMGWLGGKGGKGMSKPEGMCNSPSNPDPRISVIAGWILERMPFASKFRSTSTTS